MKRARRPQVPGPDRCDAERPCGRRTGVPERRGLRPHLVPEGECCATLCTGRVVTAEKAQGLAASARACEERGEPCAIPACAPPRARPVPVCTAGRCTPRMVPMEAR
ncbi:hypothetical protein ACLESO_07155 [Pyxidicoccus sp. 3LG]